MPGPGVYNFRPKKKQVWNYMELPEDPEIAEIMPGFEIQYMITEHTVEDNDNAVFGHCIFPAKSGHSKHRHAVAAEIMYVIKGKLVVGVTTDEGDVETVCEPGTAAFVKKNQVMWCRNPFNEPCEFIFSYYGCTTEEKSGYIEINKNTQ